MEAKTLWNEQLGMLLACASPGSALAYHLGLVSNKPELTQRTSSEQGDAGEPADASAPARRPSMQARLANLRARAEQWLSRQSMRASERYLAQAQNVSDLEARMRQLQGNRFWLP